MQSKDDEKDEQVVNRVNQLINDPLSAEESSNNNADSDLMQILSGGNGDLDMTQENLLQFIRNAGGLSNLTSSLQTPYEGFVIPNSRWTELQTKLSEISAPEQEATLDLSQVLDADTLNPILTDSDIRPALFPFINEGSERSPEEIEQLVNTPEFKSRLQVLNAAINQDALSSIIDALETDKDIVSFLKAASEQAKRKSAMDEDE